LNDVKQKENEELIFVLIFLADLKEELGNHDREGKGSE